MVGFYRLTLFGRRTQVTQQLPREKRRLGELKRTLHDLHTACNEGGVCVECAEGTLEKEIARIQQRISMLERERQLLSPGPLFFM